jgi:nuclear RNA export factor
MFPRSSTPPAGPRGSSPARRGIGRGGIQKRRGGPPRVDKDGDLVMDPVGGKAMLGSGSGGSEGNRSSRARAAGWGGQAAGTSRGNLSTQQSQQAIIRGLESQQANILESRVSQSTFSERGGPGRKDWRRDLQTPLTSLRVRGLKESKAASNLDGGLKDLLSFLERKANGQDVESHRGVRIKKVCFTVKVAGSPGVMQPPLGYTFLPKPGRARGGRNRQLVAHASCDIQPNPRLNALLTSDSHTWRETV